MAQFDLVVLVQHENLLYTKAREYRLILIAIHFDIAISVSLKVYYLQAL